MKVRIVRKDHDGDGDPEWDVVYVTEGGKHTYHLRTTATRKEARAFAAWYRQGADAGWIYGSTIKPGVLVSDPPVFTLDRDE